MKQARWLWMVRGIGLALVAMAWLELRWTDEALAAGMALVLSLPLAALFLGSAKRCLNSALGFGLVALILLAYAFYLSTGRDLGVLYYAPLSGIALILAVGALVAGGRPNYGAYLAVLVLAGLWLTFVNALDSEFRAIPEAQAIGVLHRVNEAQKIRAAGDLPAIGQVLKTMPVENNWDPEIIQALLKSRDNRFSLARYEFVFRATAGGYEVTAQPETKRWRSFFVDQSGEIRFCPRYCTASAKDPPI